MNRKLARPTAGMIIGGLSGWGLRARIVATDSGGEAIWVEEGAGRCEYWLITDQDLGINFTDDTCRGALVTPHAGDGNPVGLAAIDYRVYPRPSALVAAIAEAIWMGV